MPDKPISPPKLTAQFHFGTSIISNDVIAILPQINILDMFQRHIQGDWGDISPEDAQANEDALKNGGRLISAYNTPATAEGQIMVFTEANRQFTTFCLPSEY